MIREETIKHFEGLQKRYTTQHNGKHCAYVKEALEAMRKQIPKKPLRVHRNEEGIFIWDCIYCDGTGDAKYVNCIPNCDNKECSVYEYHCPNCDKRFSWKHEAYCVDCGQALDWEDEI